MHPYYIVALFLVSSVLGEDVLPLGDDDAPQVSARAAKCAQDNCYNAYTHSLNIASPFCSTYIRSTVAKVVTPTVTISNGITTYPAAITPITYPPVTTNTQLSSRCNLDTNAAGVPSTSLYLRLSSACTCISIIPVTVTATSVAPRQTVYKGACNKLPQPFKSTTSGKSFHLNCGKAFTLNNVNMGVILRLDGYTDFAQCLNVCAATANCDAANWAPNHPSPGKFRCTLLKGPGRTSSPYLFPFAGYDSAYLVGSPLITP